MVIGFLITTLIMFLINLLIALRLTMYNYGKQIRYINLITIISTLIMITWDISSIFSLNGR